MAAGKVALFGIVKCGGKVHTVIAMPEEILLPVIAKKILPDSVVYGNPL